MSVLSSRKRLHLALVAALFAFGLALSGCGAEGTPSPHTLAPHEDSRECASLPEATTVLHQAIDEGRFTSLSPHLQSILIDDGGMRVLLPVLLEVNRGVPSGTLLDVTQGLPGGEGLARLEPHLVAVLQYFLGRSAFVPGAHLAPVASSYAIATGCDPVSTLAGVRQLFATEYQRTDGSIVPWLDEAFAALLDVAADPIFVELLDTVDFSEQNSGMPGTVAVGKESFQLLATLITGTLAADNPDLNYVSGLVDDVLVTQLPQAGASRQKVRHLFDVLTYVTDPADSGFPQVQGLLQCVLDEDPQAELPAMIYDYLTIDALDLVAFLQDLDAMGREPAGNALRRAVISVADVLAGSPDLLREGVRIGTRFIEPQRVGDVLEGVLGFTETGVLVEAVALLRMFTAGCQTP